MRITKTTVTIEINKYIKIENIQILLQQGVWLLFADDESRYYFLLKLDNKSVTECVKTTEQHYHDILQEIINKAPEEFLTEIIGDDDRSNITPRMLLDQFNYGNE